MLNRVKIKDMAATELTFTQQTDGTYLSSFDTTGVKTIVQLNREARGTLLVYVTLDSSEDSVLYKNLPSTKDCVFEIDLPSGIGVSISSATDVTYGAYAADVTEATEP